MAEPTQSNTEVETTPSLRASILDGMSYAVVLGTAESYFVPFGVFLGASTIQIGLLATVPPLIGALCQWAGAVSMDRLKNRRRTIVSGAVIQAVACVPIGLIGIVLRRGIGASNALIGLTSVYFGAIGFVSPLWNSLIGDLVPEAIRGRYFGRRNRLTGASTFVSLLIAGGILDLFRRIGRAAFGFLVCLWIASAARFNSARWLARHEDPPWQILPDQRFTFLQFLRRTPWSNFAKFVFFFAAVNFGVAFSAPYFALYMLRDLHFSYLEYTGVAAAATIASFLTFPHWGRLGDRFGNKKILNLCGWGVGIVPLLWLFSARVPYLIAIQIFSGAVWAGFGMAAVNFMFDAVTPPKRARCAAYQAVVLGVFVCLGSLAGGWVAVRIPATIQIGQWRWTPATPLLVVFLLSGLLRFLASALLLGRFREVRRVEPIDDLELLYVASHLKTGGGMGLNIVTNLLRIGRRRVSGQ